MVLLRGSINALDKYPGTYLHSMVRKPGECREVHINTDAIHGPSLLEQSFCWNDLNVYTVALVHSFIHSGHFYTAPSSPLLLRGTPDYSTDTVSEFHAEAHRQLQVKDLPKVPTWRVELESNPRPSGWKSSSQPRHHLVPREPS